MKAGLEVGPSVAGHPKSKPAFVPSLGPLHASSISSVVSWPTSLMKIRPVASCTSNVNGLRSPRAQIARYTPEALPENGLSEGIPPSASIRSSFPESDESDCALAGAEPSPTAT